MKIYLIKDEIIAVQLAQLLKLNAECAKLHWSRTVKNVPSDVSKALDVIENFVANRVLDNCASSLFGELNDDEEAVLMRSIRKNEGLRNSIGTGVVLAGNQASEVRNLLDGMNIPQTLIEAIDSGKNVILF